MARGQTVPDPGRKARLVSTLRDLAEFHDRPRLREIADDVAAIPGDLSESYVHAVLELAASAFAPAPERGSR